MALLKIKDFDPKYHEVFGGHDIKGLDVYSDFNNEKIGDVVDLLVDEQGYFRYFIVNLGFWAVGKKVLLPVERSQMGSEGKHLFTIGLTKEQVETLPEFNESLRIDSDHKGAVPPAHATSPGTTPIPHSLEQARPLEHPHQVRQVSPPVPPQPQPYPAPNQPVIPYPPTAQQPYPVAPPQPYPTMPPAPQGQVAYPTRDPIAQSGHQPYPSAQAAGQPASVLQHFEERLRNRRLEHRR